MIEEKDILNYLDGNASPELRAKIDNWIAESPINKEEFEFTEIMWKESSACSEYVLFDVDQEWNDFEEKMSSSPLKVVSKKKEEAKVRELKPKSNWRAGLSVAASLIVLVAATWFLWPQSKYIEIVDSASDMEIILEDGSKVNLKEGASFKALRSFKYAKERNTEIAGEVTFEVAKDPERPFYVKTEESAVEVLGTIFNIKSEGVEAEVANEEGRVKFFIIKDTSQFVTLNKGDRIKYDGTGFVDLNEQPTPEPEPEPIPLVKDILNYFRTISNGRVKFGSGITDNSLKELDIDYEGKSVRQIIRLMEEKAIVIYLDNGCRDCIEFVEIIPKKR